MQFNFNDRLRIGVVILTFIAYVVVSVIAFAVLIGLWLPSGVGAQQAALMAETAPPVVTGELLIGGVLGIAAGWLVCHLTGATGLKNCLVLGVLFVLYGILGVYLHPAAALWKHAVHLIAPIPIALLGGTLRLAFSKRELAAG